MAAGTKIYSGASGVFGAAIKSGQDANAQVDMDAYLGKLFVGNGINDNFKINSSMVVSNHGIVAPSTNFTLSEINPGAGAFANGQVRKFYITFWDSVNVVESNPNPIFQSITIAAGPSNIRLSGLPTTTDTNVTHRRVYMTENGGANWFRKAEIVYSTSTIDILSNAEGTVEIEFDNNEPKKYKLVEYFDNCLFVVYEDTPCFLNQSKVFRPEQFPLPFRYGIGDALDEEIVLLKKFYDYLIIGTRKGAWVLEKNLTTGAAPHRLSGYVGMINNNACAILDNYFVFMGTDKRLYSFDPTQFSKVDVRPKCVSQNIEDLISTISENAMHRACGASHHVGIRSDVLFSVPTSSNVNNDTVLVQDVDCGGWSMDLKRVSFFANVRDGNDATKLYSGDENGFIYKNDIGNGYGAAIVGQATSWSATSITDINQLDDSGTATSGTLTELNDITKTWNINEWHGVQVYIYSGTGAGQYRIVDTNTATQLVPLVAWGVAPDATSVYHLGGYIQDSLLGIDLEIVGGIGIDQKRIVDSHDTITINFTIPWVTTPNLTSLFTVGGMDFNIQTGWDTHTEDLESTKRGWYNRINFVNTGNHTIEYAYARDVNYNSLVNTTIDIINSGSNWNVDLWGSGRWGLKNSSLSVVNFADGFEYYQRLQHRFRNRLPGQATSINYITTTFQDKGNLLV